MAYKYRVRKKIDKSKGQEQVKYYPVPVISGKTSLRQLGDRISDRCSMTRSDVLGVVDALSYMIQQELHQGNSVDMEGIGTLSVSVSSPGFDSPDQCTPGKVTVKRVCFLADKEMKKSLRTIQFIRID